ncbi:MAG: DMT family transporter [Proteobacteria bacterium]|nr:DMT family transporter [Pseudomonadota bacterium]
MSKTENLGYVLGLMGVIAFSLTLPITKFLTPHLSVWDIGFGRSLLAAVGSVLILLIYRAPWPKTRHWKRLVVVASGIAFGFPILTAVGMQSVPSSHGGVILGGMPLVTALIGCFISGERPSWLYWVVAISGFLTIAAYSLISAGGEADFALYKGDLALCGAAIFAGLGYAQGGLLARELGGWQVICWTQIVALPLLILLTWRYGDAANFGAMPISGWIAFVFLAFVNSLIGFFFWYKALAIGGVSKISQIQLLQTFFTFGFAAMWLGEAITPLMVVFLLITVVIVWFSKHIPVTADLT